MYLRSFRPLALPGPPPKRRRFPWARLILIAVICAVAAWIFVPRYLSLNAQGIIEGDLVPVAPLFNARLSDRMVYCDDTVRQGQPVATVTNFLLEGQYDQDYSKTVTDLSTERIAQVEGLTEAQIEYASARERYSSALYDAQKLKITADAYENTYKEGAIGQVAYQTALADYQAAVAEANSLKQIMDDANERVNRITQTNAAQIAGSQNELAVVNGLKNQVHAQTLAAPVSGTIVYCDNAKPENIVDAGAPIFKIFDPTRAYVVGYFDPGTAPKVHDGQRAIVSIPGFDKSVEGRVVHVYPSLEALPDQLTRYFWQKEQWSEYRPVKIKLYNVTPEIREELTYNSQVHIRIPQRSLALPRQLAGLQVNVP
jgi:multidrug resistance efflux pump